MILSIGEGKALDEVQHCCMTKTLNKLCVEGMTLGIIKVTSIQNTNVRLGGEKLKALEQDKEAHVHHFYST